MSLKIHNFLISYPILLKPFLIGLSDFSGSIESKLFLEWTWALKLICHSLQEGLDRPTRSLDRWLSHQLSSQLT